MKILPTAICRQLSLAILLLLLPQLTFAHGHHHDHEKEALLAGYLMEVTQQLRETDLSAMSEQARIEYVTQVIVQALPNPQAEECDFTCKTIYEKGQAVIKAIGTALANAPSGIKNTIRDAIQGIFQGNPVAKTADLINDLRRKGADKMADLWYRHGAMTAIFVAAIIAVTYPPYTVVTEALESLVLGAMHIWCMYFQAQYAVGVAKSLKYVESFTTASSYMAYWLFSPVAVYRYFSDAIAMRRDRLALVTADSSTPESRKNELHRMKVLARKVGEKFLGLKVSTFLKSLVGVHFDENHPSRIAEIDMGSITSVTAAKIWYESMTFMGETLKELVQSRYDDALHEWEHGHNVNAHDDIVKSFRRLNMVINQRLRKVQKFYTQWLTTGKIDVAKRDTLQQDMVAAVASLTELSGTAMQADFRFRVYAEVTSLKEKHAAVCKSVFVR